MLDADLSNEAFPFSTHKVVRAAGHLVSSSRPLVVGDSRVLPGKKRGALTREPLCPGQARLPPWASVPAVK